VGATEAVYDGTDYVITGRKSYVTNGPIADWIAVSAEVEGKPAFLLVENGQRGVDLGPRLKTLGYNGLAVSSLELNHARVPRGHVLGPFDDRSVLMFLVQTQDLILTVAGLGVMERAVAAAKDYAESHSRGRKPVSRFQETRFKLAEMLTLLQTAQLLTYRAGWLYRASDPEAATVILCAKVFGSEASEQVSTLAMQIMAGRGYISGNPVERAYRDAKFAALAGTTSEIARMSIAADLLTRHKV
jgi:alkylation response protein AidB-like acyl-CoA dehydrogenase